MKNVLNYFFDYISEWKIKKYSKAIKSPVSGYLRLQQLPARLLSVAANYMR